jgi:hypothetical protein
MQFLRHGLMYNIPFTRTRFLAIIKMLKVNNDVEQS